MVTIGYTTQMDVDKEIQHLKDAIKRLGKDNGDGTWTVKFGVLFDDEEVANLVS